MAYTIPKTWAYKESLSSADLNKYVRDNTLAMDDRFYPVGTIYTSVVATNPGTLLGFGTWVVFGAGKVMIGVDSSDSDFNSAEKTGGEKTHSLVTSEMPTHTHTGPSHTHSFSGSTGNPSADHTHSMNGFSHGAGSSHHHSSGGGAYQFGSAPTSTAGVSTHHTHSFSGTTGGAGTGATGSAGSGSAHNNLQPYVTVYMWKRTA